ARGTLIQVLGSTTVPWRRLRGAPGPLGKASVSLTTTLPHRPVGIAATLRADARLRRLALALLALAVLLGFSLPTLLAGPATVDNDAALYLSLALDASQGHGFTFDGAH